MRFGAVRAGKAMIPVGWGALHGRTVLALGVLAVLLLAVGAALIALLVHWL